MDINEDGVIEIPAARPFEGNAAASNTVMPAMDERAASSAAPAYITQWQQYFPQEKELVLSLIHICTLATRLGAAAAQLVINKNYGNMVALRGTDIVPVPLGEVAGKLKVVPKDSDIVQAARQIGVSFGDC